MKLVDISANKVRQTTVTLEEVKRLNNSILSKIDEITTYAATKCYYLDYDSDNEYKKKLRTELKELIDRKNIAQKQLNGLSKISDADVLANVNEMIRDL